VAEAEIYRLDVARHETILNDLAEDLLNSAAPSDRPTLVVIAGQNGAGKSTTYRKVLDEVTPRPAVIDGDDIRTRHPAWTDLSHRDPVLANEATYSDMKAWIGKCEQLAADRGCNVILETTLRRIEPIVETLDRFRAAGYTCRLDIVAVPPQVSAVSILHRFERAPQGDGRHVPLKIHDQAAANLARNAATLEQQGLVDEVRVRTRTGQLAYLNRRHPTGWERDPGVARAVEVHQARLGPHLNATQRDLDETVELMNQRAPTPEQRATLEIVTRRWNTAKRRPRPPTGRSSPSTKGPSQRHQPPPQQPKPGG
jgi:predicted ABC-type ATPase